MGAAKRKRQNRVPTVYHHTSTRRTNLIWMSGVIEVEGKSKGVFHPQLGEIRTDAKVRRALKDFPPVAWLTTRIEVPRVLIGSEIVIVDQGTGEELERRKPNADIANALSLNRIALGFSIADVPVEPWPEYFGYQTAEGHELNETARMAGDNPDDWYISQTPVDVLQASEVWVSRSIIKPKLERFDEYLRDIRRMVTLCRERKAYIPPSWLTPEQGEALARKAGLPVQR
jgi:hypothetical protein